MKPDALARQLQGRDALIPPGTMAKLDAAAIEAGRPGPALMERAGRSVVRAITARFAPRPVLVLCGPGNNGGDGYVIARRLARCGWPVRVAALNPEAGLKGDAAWAAGLWRGETVPLGVLEPPGDFKRHLVVDALFGAGLARGFDGPGADLLRAAERAGAPIVAVDVPSGLDGARGEVRGYAAAAALTVTFHRLKPGHLLQPGRALCGELVLADIGVPEGVAARFDGQLRANTPELWRESWRASAEGDHKYTRGHAVVLGGPMASAGASVMAAKAALKAGAGLVSVAVPKGALLAYAPRLDAVMTKPFADAESLAELLRTAKAKAALLGPGAGRGEGLRAVVLAALGTDVPLVLDADALTSFEDEPGTLFEALRPDCLLTPHAGEFARLFKGVDQGLPKHERALEAARTCGAVVLLKGSDTCVAAPDGRCAVSLGAPPWLATAGAGDVLAGIAAGLLAQGVPAFEAGCAAVWLHAGAASVLGANLAAEELPRALPEAFGRTFGATG